MDLVGFPSSLASLSLSLSLAYTLLVFRCVRTKTLIPTNIKRLSKMFSRFGGCRTADIFLKNMQSMVSSLQSLMFSAFRLLRWRSMESKIDGYTIHCLTKVFDQSLT